MSLTLQLVLIYLGSVIVVLLGLWVILPALTGLPWVPTREPRIRRALEMARVQPGETVYDLGAGDGRVLLVAARDFGARAVGIEISPLHCWQARVRAAFAGLTGQVVVRRGDFYRADLREADVVFLYITSAQAGKVRALLEGQLRDGARVVSISADIPGWEPVAVDKPQLIFLYQMPPAPGGVESYLMRQSLS